LSVFLETYISVHALSLTFRAQQEKRGGSSGSSVGGKKDAEEKPNSSDDTRTMPDGSTLGPRQATSDSTGSWVDVLTPVNSGDGGASGASSGPRPMPTPVPVQVRPISDMLRAHAAGSDASYVQVDFVDDQSTTDDAESGMLTDQKTQDDSSSDNSSAQTVAPKTSQNAAASTSKRVQFATPGMDAESLQKAIATAVEKAEQGGSGKTPATVVLYFLVSNFLVCLGRL